MENGSKFAPIEWTPVNSFLEYSTIIKQYYQLHLAFRLNVLARDIDWKGLPTGLQWGKLIANNNVILTYYGMESKILNKWTLSAAKIRSLSLM